jgi:hypothetical protein
VQDNSEREQRTVENCVKHLRAVGMANDIIDTCEARAGELLLCIGLSSMQLHHS